MHHPPGRCIVTGLKGEALRLLSQSSMADYSEADIDKLMEER